MTLTYDELLVATGGKIGQMDVACPECGPQARHAINRARRVLRVWDDGEFATYNCARCGIKGWAKPDGAAKVKREERPRAEPVAKQNTAEIAAMLWTRSAPLIGSPAETYLRSRSCLIESPMLRFLTARNGHPPAMIARFGQSAVTGVHITRLRNDGSGKAGTDKDKIMLGDSMGQPIIVHDNPDCGELVITEGIEDAATLASVMGWNAWAAGSWVRMASVIAAATGFERVYLSVDHDRDGLKARDRSRMVHPGLVVVDFAKILNLRGRVDANKVFLTYGGETILRAIEFADAQARHRDGEIGFEAMMRETVQARDLFSRMVV